MTPFKQQRLAFESVYVGLRKFGQHSEWRVAINPEGQVLVLDHYGVITRGVESVDFETFMEGIFPLDQRKKWRDARSEFSEQLLANATAKILYAVDKVETQLAKSPWLAGEMFTLADINFYCHCGMMVERMFPDMTIGPRLIDWRDRMTARPKVAEALAKPDHANPALRIQHCEHGQGMFCSGRK
jgi:glutathione S-transferase